MIRSIITAIAVVVSALTLAVVPTRAQQTDEMTITVPFAFAVGGDQLAAGTYRVHRTSATTGTYFLKSVDGHDAAAITSPARIQEPGSPAPKLVFHEVAGEYFLSQIWMPGGGVGTELAISRQERRLAQADATRRVALISNPR